MEPRWSSRASGGSLGRIAARPRRPDDAAADQSAVQAASYSTGKTGSRLKWLAQQSEPVHVDPAVKPTQCTTPEASDEPSCGRAARSGVAAVFRGMEQVAPQEEWRRPAEKRESELPPIANGKQRADKPVAAKRNWRRRQHDLKAGCPSPKDLKHISESEHESRAVGRGTASRLPVGRRRLPSAILRADHLHVDRLATLSQAAILRGRAIGALRAHGGAVGAAVRLGRQLLLHDSRSLPYKMGLELPNECVYTLGYYRPGDCAPYLFDPLPISVRGLFFEDRDVGGGVCDVSVDRCGTGRATLQPPASCRRFAFLDERRPSVCHCFAEAVPDRLRHVQHCFREAVGTLEDSLRSRKRLGERNRSSVSS